MVGLNDVKVIFEAVIELPAEEREAYLDTACATADLRRRVTDMLAADESDAWLAASTRVTPDELLAGLRDDVTVPDRLGRYTIRRRIATGGMGAVYEGEQDDPQRIVAIKVMRTHFAPRSSKRRFREEAQILARLQHPAIAQIFDAAVKQDDAGDIPYFVMEFVPGARSITEHVRERELALRDRIALFVQVCEGVHHGHQKGVVHRDLKPDNILVDEAGHPKIIDFGVARATDSDVAVTTMLADVGQLVGTLQYMSPEQLDGDPHDIDTRSDVFALGVVLFELVTDETPQDIRSLSVPEALRVLRETRPPRLSSIRPRLRGDLETIVGKALEHDRDRRYQSTLEFAQDLSRYLAGEAIAARTPSLAYRLRVIVRRHRPAAIAVTVAAVAIAAGLLLATVGLARAERNLAETEAVVTLLTDSLELVDPQLAHGRDVLLREMLDEVALTLENDNPFEADSLAEADVRITIGKTYHSLRALEPAEQHLRKALDTRRTRLGDLHPDTIEAMYELGLTLDRAGQGKAMLTEIVELYEAERIPPSIAVAGALRNLGHGLLEIDNPQSVEVCEKSLWICREILDDDHRETAMSLNLLAMAHGHCGDLELSVEFYREAIDMHVRVDGPDSPLVAGTAGNLAIALKRLRRFDEALPFIDQAVESALRVFGVGSDQADWAMSRQAKIHVDLGNLADAERIYREILEADRSGENVGPFGRRPPTFAFYGLADTLLKLRRPDEAERTMRTALEQFYELDEIKQASFFMYEWRALEVFGWALTALDRYEEAESVLLDLYEKTLDRPYRDWTKWARGDLVELYTSWGKPEEAAAWQE